MYSNFNLSTNTKQREYCLQYIKPEYVENNVTFETYLQHTAESYFSICPLGNGIDSHRIWESLYLRTVPIVEETYNISYLQRSLNLPIVIIKKWNELPNLDLNIKLYNNLIDSFNSNILTTTNSMLL